MQRRRIVPGLACTVLLGTALAWGGVTGALHAADAPPLHKTHRITVQVSGADPAVMTMVLNNIDNLYSAYKESGDPVEIELVAFGPGFTMLRDDTSPVKERLTAAHAAHPTLVFSACENSRRGASKAEGHEIKVVPEARMVPAGVVRLTELQEQGYTYLRP